MKAAEFREVTIVPTTGPRRGILPERVFLVPAHLVGRHEATKPARPHKFPNGYNIGGFQGIDLSNGWNGAPIAVAARTVCEGNRVLNNDSNLALAEEIDRAPEGMVPVFTDLEPRVIYVLDGHHRLIKSEEYEGYDLVVAQLVDYPDPKGRLELGTWHADGRILTAEEINAIAFDPDLVAEAKRTKFQVRVTRRQRRRIKHVQPTVITDRETLKLAG